VHAEFWKMPRAKRGSFPHLRIEYSVWAAMKKRCHYPKHEHYKSYGAKGIVVCPRWRDDFQAFLLDMGPRPSLEHSIDRIDGTKGYEPGNCRWATVLEQTQNRSIGARLLTFQGETLMMSEWARRLGLPGGALRSRLNKGWSVERALTTKVGAPKSSENWLTINGVRRTQADWARTTGINPITLGQRLRNGWPPEKAIVPPERSMNASSRGKLYSFQGKSLTIAQWGRETGVKEDTIAHRLRKGWAIEQALGLA
jgi:hypothetical protein